MKKEYIAKIIRHDTISNDEQTISIGNAICTIRNVQLYSDTDIEKDKFRIELILDLFILGINQDILKKKIGQINNENEKGKISITLGQMTGISELNLEYISGILDINEMKNWHLISDNNNIKFYDKTVSTVTLTTTDYISIRDIKKLLKKPNLKLTCLVKFKDGSNIRTFKPIHLIEFSELHKELSIIRKLKEKIIRSHDQLINFIKRKELPFLISFIINIALMLELGFKVLTKLLNWLMTIFG